MSMNQHAEQAVNRLRNGTINEISRARVEATLALAYEQRTANMIAALQAVRYEGGEEIIPNSDHAWATVKAINERLDLA